MTVTYNFFYQHVLLHSDLVKELYENKSSFIEIINHFHKDKMFFGENTSKKVKNQYIADLMEIEFIFYEFVEMIFFICRKYIMRKRLKEEKKHYLDLINHIWRLIKVDPMKKGEEAEKRKLCYTYSKLSSHEAIERLNEIIQQKEEIRRIKQKEVDRYMKEREALDNEKENLYIEEKKDEDDYSDESEL